jgi:hypothetical protein
MLFCFYRFSFPFPDKSVWGLPTGKPPPFPQYFMRAKKWEAAASPMFKNKSNN